MNTIKKHTMIPNATKIPINSKQWVTVEDIEKIRNTTPLNKKYVVAGNYAEYAAYIKHKGYPAKEYIYVSHVSILMGLHSISGVYIGTWKDRDDIGEIQHQINMIKHHEAYTKAMSEKIDSHIDRELLAETARKINGGLIAQTMADIPESTMRIIQAKNTLNNAIDLMQDTMWLENTKENT